MFSAPFRTWLLLLVFASAGGAGLCVAQHADGFRFERMDEVERALPQSSVTALFEDRDGFLWFGTRAGMARWDGYAMRLWGGSRIHGRGLGGNVVRTIGQDRQGNLWVHAHAPESERSNSVLTRLVAPDFETVVAYRFPSAMSEYGLGLVIGPDGTPWGVTPDSVYRYDAGRDRFEATASKYGTGVDSPALLATRDGAVWIGSNGGTLERCAPGAERCTPISGSEGLSVTALHETASGALWVGTLSGLFVYEPARQALRTVSSVMAHVLHLAKIDDRLYALTTNGLYTVPLDGVGTAEHHALSDLVGVPDFAGRALLRDRSGSVWLATLFGVFRQRAHTRPFGELQPPPDDTANPVVMGLAVDPAGGVWTGTISGVLRRTANGQAQTFVLPEPLARLGPPVYWDIEASEEAVWVGHTHGLSRYDRESGRWAHAQRDTNPATSGVSPNQVQSLYIDGDTTVWVATAAAGLLHFDPARQIFSDNLLPAVVYVSAVYADAEAVWAGTLFGLYRIDRESGAVRHFLSGPTDSTSLSHSVVHFVQRDRAGRLWVGTDGGLSLLVDEETGRFQSWGRDLPSSTIYGALETEAGTFWLSTNRGLVHFDPENAERLMRPYQGVDGLVNVEFNRQAFTEGPDGRFYFGGDRGVTVFEPEAVRDDPYAPPVVLTHAEYGEGTTTHRFQSLPPEGLILPPDHHALRLEFAALDFAASQRNRYAVRLEGAGEQPWTDLGTQRQITYGNLPPGRYTLHVRATNADDVWSRHQLAIRLVVEPPFWRTSGFIAGAVLLLLGLSGGAWWARERQQRARQARLERLVAERTERLAEAVRTTEEQAGRLRRLDAAKNRFFANLSHEFRTPLALILGPLGDALRGEHGELPAAFRAQLGAAQRHAQRLLRLIEQVLDLTRIEHDELTLRPRSVDLVAFTDAAVRAYQPLAEQRRLTLSFQSAMTSLPAVVDPERLETLLANLLANALKFTPAGGRVWVTLGTVGEVGAAGTPPTIELVVKDTGPGMAPEVAAHIFDRFYQDPSNEPTGGTGIGLALAKELTELHGGAISVESDFGFGAAFTVTLPWAEPDRAPVSTFAGDGSHIEAAPVLMPPPREDSADAERATVLIVEDHPDVRALLRAHLGGSYCVLEAEDGEAGLEKAREHVPDLILSDVMMPRMDGVALCRAVRSDSALGAVPILLLTARVGEADVVRGLEAGADDYVTKPYSAPELRARVARLIATRLRMRASATGHPVQTGSGAVVAPQSEDEVFVQQVLAVIAEHLGDAQFNAGRLAEALHVSPRHLRRKLGALLGETPSDLLRRLRLERAAYLLETRIASVSEIAYQVGFKTPSHFAAAFRDHFGCTPSEHEARASV